MQTRASLLVALVVSGLALAAAACTTATAPAPGPAAGNASGRAFVERACAGCHATGPSGASAHPRAPAFRDLARTRSDAQLAAAIGEISRNGHVEMPPIYVTPEETTAVVAYMRSLTGRAS
ncbi:c-type cytochrome [Phenylobacterium soli]|uniref:Cytochrome c n=1 Tax=Phenylobacterium soli TaxID=2170551 RepID=A0A328AH76_9CAUL|nr:cytochrome c [Phenylobacterium soli]RAK54009.1 cytochrome c [Phenylobacterium soli]